MLWQYLGPDKTPYIKLPISAGAWTLRAFRASRRHFSFLEPHCRASCAHCRGLDFEGMCATLSKAPPGSTVLLHACAHNPTGARGGAGRGGACCRDGGRCTSLGSCAREGPRGAAPGVLQSALSRAGGVGTYLPGQLCQRGCCTQLYQGRAGSDALGVRGLMCG